jgi:hypothetical protein
MVKTKLKLCYEVEANMHKLENNRLFDEKQIEDLLIHYCIGARSHKMNFFGWYC